VKRLALLALLLASSSLVAAPAPIQKPQRKAERPVAQQDKAVITDVAVWNLANGQQLRGRGRAVVFFAVRAAQPQQVPAQPKNADPPG
jgi:hypothetical protein